MPAPLPLLGYRVWLLDRGSDELRSSMMTDTRWPEPVLKATCHRKHKAPQEKCRCGVYAGRELKTLRWQGLGEMRELVLVGSMLSFLFAAWVPTTVFWWLCIPFTVLGFAIMQGAERWLPWAERLCGRPRLRVYGVVAMTGTCFRYENAVRAERARIVGLVRPEGMSEAEVERLRVRYQVVVTDSMEQLRALASEHGRW